MSKDYYQEALGGTRRTAFEAIPKIEADLRRYGNSGHKDARKHQVIFTNNVLTGICRNCETLRSAAHYDVYVDIYTKVLAPQLDPAASPSHWKRLLPLLEYLFLMLAEYNFYAEAYKLYLYFGRVQLDWPDSDDLKYLLNVHGTQLQILIKQLETSAKKDTIKERVAEALTCLTALFESRIKRQRESPIDCATLVKRFLSYIITSRPAVQTQLTTTLQCAQLDSMFSRFLELMKVNSKHASSEDSSAKFYVHIEALRQFVLMDIQSKLQQQWGLQLARLVRDMEFVKDNEFIEYCCGLLYNLLKVVYVRGSNIKVIYSMLTKKFCSFLKDSGELLMQEEWFQDFFVLVFFIIFPMQTASSEVFAPFWQQMDILLYEAHFKLIAELLRCTPFLTKLKMVRFSCCKNPKNWFHIQLNLTQIALETYAQLLKRHKSDTKQEFDSLQAISTEISTILQNSIETLISMENECTKSAISISKLCVTFAKLLQEASHHTHASSLLSLATDMTRLKSRISSNDWIMIMRRVNKIASTCGDAATASEILSCFLAELICKPKETEYMTLHSFVQFHHHGTPGNCLFDIYTQSTSPFKPLLQKHEKRFFHWIEMQSVCKFYDKEKDTVPFTNLAQHSQTKYDFINAVRAGKLIDSPSMFNKVQNIYDMLRNAKKSCEKSTSSSLSRLQELTLAHAISMLLFKRCEDQKVTMSSKDFQESNFDQLFQEKSFVSLSVVKEMEMIDMALEAFHAFQAFFTRFDAEPLDSNDGYFLDWTRILEDLVSLAVYFQTAGYLEHALETWLLHYQIANTIDDAQSSLRSLAFFCEQNIYFQNDKRLNLSNEVQQKYDSIIQSLEDLPNLLRRQQNFILICVCQIAYFYACRKQFCAAQRLLMLVNDVHKHKLKRQDYDIVLFTADIVNFRILWKHMPPEKLNDSTFSLSKESANKDRCLLHEIDVILENIRTFVQVSSTDIQAYTILLLNSVNEFAEYAANRLCASFLGGYLSSTLKICVEAGMAVRTVQLLCKWVFINLQMEYLRKAEIKMQFIECILDTRDAKSLASSLKAANSCAVAVSKQLQDVDENGILHVGIEEVREVSIMPSDSLLIKEKPYIPLMALDYKLDKCLYQKKETKFPRLSQVVLWRRFELSCLRARFNFLSYHYKNLETFYENCEKWLEKRKETFLFQAHQSTVFLCMWHYANYLRINGDYEKAIKHLNMCIEHCALQEGKLDSAYYKNFKLQLQDTILEQSERKHRILPDNKNAQLFDFLAKKVEKTPAQKSSKYAALPMTTTCKKPSSTSSTLKSAAFIIYSDRKSPRKVNVTQNELLAAKKGLKFSDSSSSSGSESSVERKSKKTQNFNTCQAIELSDSDCDIEADKPKNTELATKSTTSTSQQQQKKGRLKFLDSVELEDLVVLKTPATSRTQRKNSSKEELQIVNEMKSLTIETATASTSKQNTVSVRSCRRSPRLASNVDISPLTAATNTEIVVIVDEESPLTPGVATKSRNARKRNTKVTKTSESTTSVVSLSSTTPTVVGSNATDSLVPEVSASTRRLRVRKATTTTSTATSIVRRGQRN